MSTECFESFNAIFRNASIYSNHQAPSHDIACKLADQEGLKHRILGTFWPMADPDGGWQTVGPRIRDFLQEHPAMQHLVGWTEARHLAPGSFKLPPLLKGEKEHPVIPLCQTAAINALNKASYDLNSTWVLCKYVISQAEDQCGPGSWVCAPSFTDVCFQSCCLYLMLIISYQRIRLLSLDASTLSWQIQAQGLHWWSLMCSS